MGWSRATCWPGRASDELVAGAAAAGGDGGGSTSRKAEAAIAALPRAVAAGLCADRDPQATGAGARTVRTLCRPARMSRTGGRSPRWAGGGCGTRAPRARPQGRSRASGNHCWLSQWTPPNGDPRVRGDDPVGGAPRPAFYRRRGAGLRREEPVASGPAGDIGQRPVAHRLALGLRLFGPTPAAVTPSGFLHRRSAAAGRN